MNRFVSLAVFVTSVVLILLVQGFLGGPVVAEEGEAPAFVGPKDCKKCHFKQYKSWTKNALAQSYEALKPGQAEEAKTAAGLDVDEDYTTNPDCLRCHTTGYGTDTGFPAVVEGQEWTEEELERVEKFGAVTCEACHGPGSLYGPFKKDNKEYQRAEIVALGALAPVAPENCNPCHVRECPTMAEDYTFDFEERRQSEGMHEHKPLEYEH
ncbi:MAG: cytochrome c family protein [Planctomycetota bacterium]